MKFVGSNFKLNEILSNFLFLHLIVISVSYDVEVSQGELAILFKGLRQFTFKTTFQPLAFLYQITSKNKGNFLVNQETF